VGGVLKKVMGSGLMAALAAFLLTIPLITGFDASTAAMQFQEDLPWISRFNVRYRLGVDGISVWFVLLTAFALGLALSLLDSRVRIEILAFPLLGLVLWNLVVYAVLALSSLRRRRTPSGTAGSPLPG
jgi:NADH-quinone oxidoreductase subunit M